jgi:2-phospho-L-lactate/phosphoenolpyruvate guanylyltransferase
VTRRTIAVIPVRSLEGAKSRLGEALDPEERRALVERLLRRAVEAATHATAIHEVIVVSPDPEVLALATTLGATGLAQGTQGLNQALDEARARVPSDARLLILPGDLPQVSAAALDALLAESPGPPSVVLVTDRHGRGTNALVLDPAGIIPFAFGGDSREAHACLARAAEARLLEPESELQIDLDTPDDLLLAESIAPEVLGVG